MWRGFIGWHVLQEGMYYRRTCVRLNHVFMRVCLLEGNVL